MYLGLDIGTSAVKALLVGEDQAPLASAEARLTVQRPRPHWSEQDPEAWWNAVLDAVAELRSSHPRELAAVRAVGLAGQMHGAVLLDGADRVLRPAILWNDGRSAGSCRTLAERAPRITEITGNLAMPGFTAPKLLWVAEHEPEIARAVTKVLLPKDYVRLRLSGDYATDVSDAAGTLWLDVRRRCWSAEMLAASGLSEQAMPEVFEGTAATGTLRRSIANDWGMRAGVVIAAGAGDNAAGAVGAGVIGEGDAFLSLGTSGVLFVARHGFSPNVAQAVHTFCHCLPGRWHQMSVILSAASCLSWITRATAAQSEAVLLGEIEAQAWEERGRPLFLPYLSGERTPHNDPDATGVFFGIEHSTTRADLGRAVLEGVAFAFVDGRDALLSTGSALREISVIGGGARSRLWGRILASALGQPLSYRRGGELGPAFGAARLARLALSNEDVANVCTAPEVEAVIEPEPGLAEVYGERIRDYRGLYERLRGFSPASSLRV
jgi:xylulokinase